MARKKKSKGGSKKGRRRVSGIKGSPLTTMLTVGAGMIGGNMLIKMLPAGMDEKYKALIMGAGGFLLPRFVKGQMMSNLAIGVGAAGVFKLAQAVAPGMLGGMGGTSYISGYYRARKPRSLNGVEPGMVAGAPAAVAGGSTMTDKLMQYSLLTA